MSRGQRAVTETSCIIITELFDSDDDDDDQFNCHHLVVQALLRQRDAG